MLFFFVGLLFFQLIQIDKAEACSCMRQAPSDAVEEAASVFEGRVTSVTPDDEGFQVTLAVVRHWKGADAESWVVHTAGDSAQCGFPFETGKSYLVYSRRGTEDGVEHVGLCSRTGPIGNAHEDLALLGAGVTPVDPANGPGSQPAVRPRSSESPAKAPGDSVKTQASPAPSSGGCQSCSIGQTYSIEKPRRGAAEGTVMLLLFVLGWIRCRAV